MAMKIIYIMQMELYGNKLLKKSVSIERKNKKSSIIIGHFMLD